MDQTLAFVFPGQGSQSIGMFAELAKKYPLIKTIFALASEVLNYDLWDITQNGPENTLNKTEVTQPALLVADICAWKIWCEQNKKLPSLLAGHSLGEYAALVAASVIEFKDAVKLVSLRGQYMQQAVPEGEGAMAAIIGLDNEQIQAICNEAKLTEVVCPANFNAIGQTVIGGHKNAVLRAIDLAEKAGCRMAKLIPMSVPSHCALMQSAAYQLEEALKQFEFNTPQIAVINNVDVEELTQPSAIKDALVRQLTRPVRWVEIILAMQAKGIENIIECGPGKVLAGLNKRISRSIKTTAIEAEL